MPCAVLVPVGVPTARRIPDALSRRWHAAGLRDRGVRAVESSTFSDGTRWIYTKYRIYGERTGGVRIILPIEQAVYL